MEQNYNQGRPRSVKKVKKVTMTAAAVLCVVTFLLGIIISSAVSSGKVSKAKENAAELAKEVERLEDRENEYTLNLENKIKELNEQVNSLTSSVNQAKEQQVVADQEEENAEAVDSAVVDDAETSETAKSAKKSSNPLKTVLTIVLVIIILGCIAFAVTIFLKKGGRNDDYFDEDDYEDDDEYDYEDEDDYEDDDYDDEEYDDDEYDDED